MINVNDYLLVLGHVIVKLKGLWQIINLSSFALKL